MPVSRNRSLTELAIQTDISNQEPGVRNSLSVYSKSEVDAALSGATASILPTLASISGALDARIDIIEANIPEITGNISALTVQVSAVSAGAALDVYNLDVTLTDLIYNHIIPNSGTPAITATHNAWGRINNISGGPFYIRLFK